MAMTEMSLKAFLSERCDGIAIENSTPLFSSGILDSMALIQLLDFIEAESGCSIDPLGISMEALDSIARILELVNAH